MHYIQNGTKTFCLYTYRLNPQVQGPMAKPWSKQTHSLFIVFNMSTYLYVYKLYIYILCHTYYITYRYIYIYTQITIRQVQVINQSICSLSVPDWVIIPGTTLPPILLLVMVWALHYCTLVYHIYTPNIYHIYLQYRLHCTAGHASIPVHAL